MRSILRIGALVVVLLAMVLPLAAHASGGPCPDDPYLSRTCVNQAPPYYVVTNRSVEYLYPTRPGTGCQPIILKNPNCRNCASTECTSIDVQTKVCRTLPPPPPGDSYVVYEMCCDCGYPNGMWKVRVRDLQPDGTCPLRSTDWVEGLPPGTGVDLPVPIIVGGLAVAGVGLFGAGLLVRRRVVRTA